MNENNPNITSDMIEAENKALKEFKAKLEEKKIKVDWEIHNEYTLKRFLRARQNNVDAAFEMFTKCLEWRKDIGADTILERKASLKYKELLHSYWPGREHGVDKRGMAVFYEKLGSADIKSIMSSIPFDDCVQYHVYRLEKARVLKYKISKDVGKDMYSHIVIENFDGFGLGQMGGDSVTAFKKLAKIGEDNYPESLRKYYIINAPSIINMAYKLISPFMDERTLNKVVICGSDYLDALQQDIDISQIPKEIGGKCNCKGKCVPVGGTFITVKKNGETWTPQPVTVSRRDKYQCKVKVEEEGCCINWNFKLESLDISFSIERKNKEKREVVLKEKKSGR